jgi:Multicopper oxidase
VTIPDRRTVLWSALAPEAGHVDLGGPVVPTWSFGGQVANTTTMYHPMHIHGHTF